MDLIPFENVAEKFTPEILLAMAEVQQARSNFQLEKFVVNQHETLEMQYVQTLRELQQLYYTIRSVSLSMKKAEIEISRKRATGDEVDEIEAQIKELNLEQTRLVGIGAFRELEKLLSIYDSFEHKYTREEAAFPNEYVKHNKYWAPVARVDNVYGDRNLVCSCPSMDEYKDEAA